MLNHPSIAKCHELFMEEENERIYFIMEYCAFKSLKHILHKRHVIKENLARILIKSILNAIDHMHSKGVCHRDLKPDNILIQGLINFFPP